MFSKLLYKAANRIQVNYLRKSLLGSFSSYGTNFRFDPTSKFIDPQCMVFGDDVFVNTGAHFSGRITVGKDVMFGPNVSIFAHDHYFAVKGKTLNEVESIWRHKPVSIGDHCWIGASVTIVSGVHVGIGSVVAAGSVVTKDCPPYCLMAGNPAVPVRKIFDDHCLVEHLTLLGTSIEQAKDIEFLRSSSLGSLKLPSIEQQL